METTIGHLKVTGCLQLPTSSNGDTVARVAAGTVPTATTQKRKGKKNSPFGMDFVVVKGNSLNQNHCL